jgi:hypothetical protein
MLLFVIHLLYLPPSHGHLQIRSYLELSPLLKYFV